MLVRLAKKSNSKRSKRTNGSSYKKLSLQARGSGQDSDDRRSSQFTKEQEVIVAVIVTKMGVKTNVDSLDVIKIAD